MGWVVMELLDQVVSECVVVRNVELLVVVQEAVVSMPEGACQGRFGL